MSDEHQGPAGLSAIQALDYMAAMRTFYSRTMRFPFVRELSPNWVEYRIGPNILALATGFRFVANQTLEPGKAAVQLAFRVPYEAVDVCDGGSNPNPVAADRSAVAAPDAVLCRSRRQPCRIYADF